VAKQAPKKNASKGTSMGGKKPVAKASRSAPAARSTKPVTKPSNRSASANRPSAKTQAEGRIAGTFTSATRDRATTRDASREMMMQPPAGPQAPPVPTNGKPRKNQAGMHAKELEHFRDLLLQKRREIVGDMSQMEREALRTGGGSNLSNLPLHMADMGTDNYEQEFTLGLVEKDRNLLRDLNTALAKIMDGTYGICEGTGKPISKVRLEAQPWARFSIEYARQREKNYIR